MKVELFILEDRMSYLIKKLIEDDIKILKYDIETSIIIFELESSLDVLSIFHTGIRIGINEQKNINNQ